MKHTANSHTTTIARLALLTLVLLLIAAGRFLRLDVDATEVRVDEFWSVWQTFGSITDILRWTPYDWPPGYYLTLGAWRELVGLHPVALRVLSVLAFLVGASATWRVVAQLDRPRAALVAMLAYAALGYNIFLSTELRGYALLLALLPLTLWALVAYFEHPRLISALGLALGLAAMFYVSLSSVAAFAMLGLYSLAAYPRRLWRWWLPGLIAALLALPEIINKAAIAAGRVSATSEQTLRPFVEALANIYSAYAGDLTGLWAALFILATVMMLAVATRIRRSAWVWLAWSLTPVALYVLNPLLGLFQARYAWWVMFGLAVWLGVGLARLPRAGSVLVTCLFAGLLFVPPPLDRYQIPDPPLSSTFAWLSRNARWGDVVLLDPDCAECSAREQLDYLTRVYFPQGLSYVQSPEGYRRVWYVTGSRPDSSTASRVQRGRLPGPFYGPAEMLWRLYEGPPNPDGIPFANGMRFHGLETPDHPGPVVLHEGETLRLRLWWSADEPVNLDYSVGLYLRREERTHVQTDSAPNIVNGPPQTSQWEPGNLYVEEREMTLPYPTRNGDYQLALAVYFWQDQVPISVSGADDNGLLPVLTVSVKAW